MNRTTTLAAGNTPARKAYRRPATQVVKLGTANILEGSIGGLQSETYGTGDPLDDYFNAAKQINGIVDLESIGDF